jgi:hypothetical protein
MEISVDRAYWLLQGFCTRSVRLHFGGRIAGEDATCDAEIAAVDRELQLAIVELFEADSTRSWYRTIPLRDATFHMSMLGEPDFLEWGEYPFHLVLVLRYPDATTLLFAERFRLP